MDTSYRFSVNRNSSNVLISSAKIELSIEEIGGILADFGTVMAGDCVGFTACIHFGTATRMS